MSVEVVIVISMALSWIITRYISRTGGKPYRAKDIGMTWLFLGAGLSLVLGKLLGAL